MKALLSQLYDDFIYDVMLDVLGDRSTMIFCTKTKLKEDLEKAIKDNLEHYSFNLGNDEAKKAFLRSQVAGFRLVSLLHA